MTESHEFNAATVEEALEKASKRLGVPEEELSYEVLDPGSPGFLGIGARDARISVATTGSEDTVVEPPAPDDEQAEEPSLPDPEPVAAVEQEPEESTQTPEQGSPTDIPVPEDLLSEIKEYATTAVEGMGFEARVDVYDAGEFIAVDVSPGDAGLFIGQKGETIDALQHLLNISVYRSRDFVKRIIIDSEGYRQRRIEAVQGMAHRMARRAAREGRTIELPPMSASERRVVHMYLKENPKVSTDSEGTGENRRVNISPIR